MKIRGTFCERKINRKHSGGTFRWKRFGKAWLFLTCKTGRRRRSCRVYKILVPAGGERCRIGKKVRKW